MPSGHTYIFLNFFFGISRLCGSSTSFFFLIDVDIQSFFDMFIEKYLHINGPAQCHPLLFKDQLYSWPYS